MWCVYTMEYNSAIKQDEMTNAFVSNIDGPGDDCTNWRKSYRVGQKA